jgi:hypothetical protein
MALKESCCIHLGKYGDLMVLMPGWKHSFDKTGIRPLVMVSQEFANLFDGVSYVRPWAVPLHWYGECGKARIIADKEFGAENVTFPKWWDDPTFVPPPVPSEKVNLTIRDKKVCVPKKSWFSYMSSQWTSAGFDIDRLFEPVVFDRRDMAREQKLVADTFKTRNPKILVCCQKSGSSSPFPFEPEVHALLRKYSDTHEVVDISTLKAHRIYDLLGLYDRAALLITSDTATLHLASSSFIPYIAFIQNGGGGSLPRGQCHLTVRYADAVKRMPEVDYVVANLVNRTRV